MTPNQFTKISEWQNETFPSATALSKVSHLKQEVSELFDELAKFEDGQLNEDDLKTEFADCFILLYGAASSFGLTLFEINECINAKHNINLKRKWGKPDENGVVNHIKD